MYFNPIHATRIMIVYSLYIVCFGSIPAPDVNIGGIRLSYAHAETRCLRTRISLVLTHAFLCVSFLLVVGLYICYSSLGSESLVCCCQRQRAHYVASLLRESAVESRFCRFWTNQQVLRRGRSHRLNVAGVRTEDDEQQSQWAFGNVDNYVAV